MSETANIEQAEPAQAEDEVKFPPLPDATDDDFDEEVTENEKAYFKKKYSDITSVVNERLHCTACDRHLGSSAKNESRMKQHPLLRTLVCQSCHSFYNSGEFDKGDDGSELYCRWCGQGGQVYCCSDCPHVFCAKCIKRNFGPSKIKEIENTDDWKCFKCNPKCLEDLRSICWALLRYCDLKNRVIFKTEDPQLKEQYRKVNNEDLSQCCKNKTKRTSKIESAKKSKEKEEITIKKAIKIMSPSIQVKKFAAINNEDLPKLEKKPVKRPASPKIIKSVTMKNIAISATPGIKKIRSFGTFINPIRMETDKKSLPQYVINNRPIQPKPMKMITGINQFNNGFTNLYALQQMNRPTPAPNNDYINLSLDNLTQGLDLANVGVVNDDQSSNDVVCTPDFPLEPLCEVTEDADDDVQCITPGPVVAPILSHNHPPPLVPRKSMPQSENIIQMTDNDVTVNQVTGGLKFRVDPQTLSSNKMYRLPDGRVFAININPNMPGGYSATIVSVSDTTGKVAPKGETFAAKLSTVSNNSTPKSKNKTHSQSRRNAAQKSASNKTNNKRSNNVSNENRECDLKVPVEWYRYNLIDAMDALEYSMSRLSKVKKETTSVHLRTRTVDEMRYLHKTLDQMLLTSSKRFLEIRDSLNAEFRQYLRKKKNNDNHSSEDEDDDDDVFILPDEEPISIDENSMDSINGTHEVDLTEANSSGHNDSSENKNNASTHQEQQTKDPLENSRVEINESSSDLRKTDDKEKDNKYDKEKDDKYDKEKDDKYDKEKDDKYDKEKDDKYDKEKDDSTDIENDNESELTSDKPKDDSTNESSVNTDVVKTEKVPLTENDVQKSDEPKENSEATEEIKQTDNSDSKDSPEIDDDEPSLLKEIDHVSVATNGVTELSQFDELDDLSRVKTDSDEQMKDVDMSDETIESLLKDNGDNVDNIPNLMDIAELEEG